MKVEVNRGACCHVGGDIDFDKHNNLWLVTGDDTPAGGGNSGGWGPHNDMKTDETQTVRTLNATGGTFTITFDGQTTAPIAFDANSARGAVRARRAEQRGARRRRGELREQPVHAADPADQHHADDAGLRRAVRAGGRARDHDGRDGPDRHDADGAGRDDPAGGPVPAAVVRRAPLVAQHERPARQDAADQGRRGRQLPVRRRATCSPPAEAGTRPEIYAMGFRNPFRIQVDSDDVAYIDGLLAGLGGARGRCAGPPAPAGWRSSASRATTAGRCAWRRTCPCTSGTSTRAGRSAQPHGCGDPAEGPVEHLAAQHRPGRRRRRSTQPDLWYSFQDTTWGTPCLEGYNTPSIKPCVNLFPELATGGVGPHGAAKYEYDPANPQPDEVPAVLRRRRVLRRVHAGHAQGDPARRGQARSSRSTRC